MLPSSLANNMLLLFIKDNKFIAHHGIQRSGTNYLNECLWSCGIFPLNSFNEKRNSPKHKHFRWYVDKELIPDFLRNNYNNNVQVNNIYELNDIAGYPKDCSHIVIKRKKEDWLVSFLNYYLHYGWFPTQEDALHCVDQILIDFNNYYQFWESMQEKHPSKVIVITYEAILNDFRTFLKSLSTLNIKPNCRNFDGKIMHVPMSNKTKRKILHISDLESYF